MAGKFFNGVLDHKFSEATCFLCGKSIKPGKDTIEHVIPKWVQNRFDLWNVRVHLLNGTLIKYRNLVIPCCPACNNERLAKVEQAVSASVNAGADAVRDMDRVVLMQWLLKIFFGFLYREVFLPFDRTKPEAGNIVVAEDMEQFQVLHYMLQSVRIPTKFDAFDAFGVSVPASIFVFDLKEPVAPFRFDYKDDVMHRCMCLRLGKVGIIVAFDCGAQAFVGAEYFQQYYGHPLHPIQFDELAASLFAKARVLLVNPKTMFVETPKEISFYVLPLTTSPTRPMFGELLAEDVGEFLWRFARLPREVVIPQAGRRITFLHADDGLFRDIPIDA
jgi:hypothetical protein